MILYRGVSVSWRFRHPGLKAGAEHFLLVRLGSLGPLYGFLTILSRSPSIGYFAQEFSSVWFMDATRG